MQAASPPRTLSFSPLPRTLGDPLSQSPLSPENYRRGRRHLSEFEAEALIGRGATGKVFLVRHRRTGGLYACKVMSKKRLEGKGAAGVALTERDVLALVGEESCPFIVTLVAAFQTHTRLFLVMDFASGGELMFHMRKEALILEDDARFYAAELVCALQFLHERNIVHRDIKGENVLLDAEGHVQLTDFGLSKNITGLDEQAHSWVGTEEFMAPEIIARELHSGKAADWWSLGVFIYDMLVGHPPFSSLRERHLSRKKLHERILKAKFKLPTFLSGQACSIIRAFLKRDPAQRLIDPKEIRRHPWFKGINWRKLENKELKPPIDPPANCTTDCFSPTLTSCKLSPMMSPRVEPLAAPGQNTDSGTNNYDSLIRGFSYESKYFELLPVADGATTTTRAMNEGACATESVEQIVEDVAAFRLDSANATEVIEGLDYSQVDAPEVW